jgi:hypothetical protein
MNPREYRENRARFSRDELVKYQGQWLAFTLDGRKIVASHEDLGALDKLVVAAGVDPQQVGFEWIELDDSSLGCSGLV